MRRGLPLLLLLRHSPLPLTLPVASRSNARSERIAPFPTPTVTSCLIRHNDVQYVAYDPPRTAPCRRLRVARYFRDRPCREGDALPARALPAPAGSAGRLPLSGFPRAGHSQTFAQAQRAADTCADGSTDCRT